MAGINTVTGWGADEVGKVLSALGGKIEELGAKIEPKS